MNSFKLFCFFCIIIHLKLWLHFQLRFFFSFLLFMLNIFSIECNSTESERLFIKQVDRYYCTKVIESVLIDFEPYQTILFVTYEISEVPECYYFLKANNNSFHPYSETELSLKYTPPLTTTGISISCTYVNKGKAWPLIKIIFCLKNIQLRFFQFILQMSHSVIFLSSATYHKL